MPGGYTRQRGGQKSTHSYQVCYTGKVLIIKQMVLNAGKLLMEYLEEKHGEEVVKNQVTNITYIILVKLSLI